MPSVWQTFSKRTGEPHPHYRFWYLDYLGRRKYGTGTMDEEQTLKLATMLEEEHREVRLGLRPVPAENHLVKRYAEVRDEYLAWGAAQGGRKGRPWSPTHLRNKRSRLEWWEDLLKLRTMGDLLGTLSKVEQALRELRQEGRSPKTIVEYGDALDSFCKWCVKREYLSDNPLKHLQRGNTEPVETRRALTPEEISKLLLAAPPDRQLLYTLALLTGLRANELARLTPKHLDVENGLLLLDPAWTKNRKEAVVALPARMVEALKQRTQYMKPGELLLCVPTHTARSLDLDLEKAGIAKVTDEGKVDFHSLRTTFVTLLLDSGATPKEAQELARHSTINLTMNTYARARKLRLAEITESVAEVIGIGDTARD